MGDLEVAMGTRALGVDDAFGDSFAIKVGQFVNEMKVLQQPANNKRKKNRNGESRRPRLAIWTPTPSDLGGAHLHRSGGTGRLRGQIIIDRIAVGGGQASHHGGREFRLGS